MKTFAEKIMPNIKNQTEINELMKVHGCELSNKTKVLGPDCIECPHFYLEKPLTKENLLALDEKVKMDGNEDKTCLEIFTIYKEWLKDRGF